MPVLLVCRGGGFEPRYQITPSLHVDYKHTTIKQYHKEGRALRTETTINDTRDFGIGKQDGGPRTSRTGHFQMSGSMEALRRNALGFRNLTNYRWRSLLHSGALHSLVNAL